MRKINVKMLAEAGIMLALAQLLSYVKVWTALMGGSVTLASMVPILIFAIRWGLGKGVLLGVIFGTLQFVLGPIWSFHPLSILFDYLVAFGCLGLAGLIRKSTPGMLIGSGLGIAGRFVCHVVSGVLVFASFAPEGQSPLVYSILYNGSYMVIELIISVAVVFVMLRFTPILDLLKNKDEA